MASATVRGGTGLASAAAGFLARAPLRCRVLYQVPICHSTAMATSAASPNQAMAPCPCGMTTAAASSGPTALPVLPPTWKIDCASPGCPPEARRAMREDSGWNTDEPVPTRAAATSTVAKLGATDSSSRPHSVEPMPKASECGLGCRSVYRPTSGCSSEAVSW